ncbi:hypothetical protein [Lactobacillus intestinalis]|uniref:hypothetical protein n=1 Tax=Lactobacillus intestinalis TaxID=151781 RepID=UPI00202CF512|nr:hypothetical protein [Lactobacillus intestinalis]
MEKWQLVSTSIILPIIVNLVSHILEKLVDERLKSHSKKRYRHFVTIHKKNKRR